MERDDQKECETGGSCTVESVVTIDERGQMVLPKEIRDKAQIKGGDKLAIIGWEKEGQVCCITLMKAEELGNLVGPFLGTVMSGVEG